MSLAQGLYEGIELGDAGHQGLITYMRTDSTRISDRGAGRREAVHRRGRFGSEYIGAGRTSRQRPTAPTCRTPTRRSARPT